MSFWSPSANNGLSMTIVFDKLNYNQRVNDRREERHMRIKNEREEREKTKWGRIRKQRERKKLVPPSYPSGVRRLSSVRSNFLCRGLSTAGSSGNIFYCGSVSSNRYVCLLYLWVLLHWLIQVKLNVPGNSCSRPMCLFSPYLKFL